MPACDLSLLLWLPQRHQRLTSETMKTQPLLPIFALWIVISTISFVSAQEADPAGSSSIDIEMRTIENDTIVVPSTAGYQVVCFLGIECPLAKLYAPRINEIAKRFESKGFQFIAINSNRQDSTQEWREFTASMQFQFSVVKDLNNIIADKFQITRNPEVVVIDADGSVVYRGRIDDQYSPGVSRSKASREDLKIALTELSAGKPVSVSVTEPAGCLIGRIKKPAKQATVTYAKHIAPIFKKNCVECHRAGEIGPFAMSDYDEIVGWADMIVETIDDGRMPPWHASPKVGQFTNARGLTENEKQLVRIWVTEGAQLGNPKDLPESKQYTTGWRLPRTPDLVVPMSRRPFKVPAEGTVEYQYFVVDPNFKEDKWVSAAQIIPGNRAVVHHSIVFIRPPDGQLGLGLNFLEGYVPGQVPVKHVATMARKIPAGSKLVFQQHYTPNGKTQTDLTKIGLVFVDEDQVSEELMTLVAINQEFEIHPQQPDLTVTAKLPWLPAGGKLLSVSPHMHYRGKSFVASSVSGDSKRPLLSVPNYDFNWQHNYEFAEALDLDELQEIEISISFDNSTNNPFNPDPSQYVIWGDQTWEEMAVGFFNISRPRVPEKSTPAPTQQQPEPPAKKQTEKLETAFSPTTHAQAKAHARQLIEKNDSNGDGKLDFKELPRLVRYKYRSYDADQDGFVTAKEIETAARDAFHRLESQVNQQ